MSLKFRIKANNLVGRGDKLIKSNGIRALNMAAREMNFILITHLPETY